MSELLDFINECENDNEIKEVIDTYIEAYSMLSYDLNPYGSKYKTIGRIIDINPKKELNNFSNSLIANNRWFGYIPSDVKVVYATTRDEKGYYNEGNYYYIKDRQYLYDFAKLIKGEIKYFDFDLFISYVYIFITKFFENKLNSKKIEDINKLLLNNKGDYIKSSIEPDIINFKNSGCALCSEYSPMAQNIMSLFGYEMLLIFDEKHAYNILYDNKKTYIVDFQSGVNVYDYSCTCLGKIPFVCCIDDYSEEKLEKLLYEGQKIELKDFELYRFDKESLPLENGYKRVYGVDKIKKI